MSVVVSIGKDSRTSWRFEDLEVRKLMWRFRAGRKKKRNEIAQQEGADSF